MGCRGKLTLLQWVFVSNSPTAAPERRGGHLAPRARALPDGSVPPPPIARLFGFRLLSAEPGRALFELDTDLERQANPMGTLHGGIRCELADAELAEAAAAQGRFWDMHDRLFAGQDALDDDSLLRYAHELSLRTERVSDELTNHTHAERVESDRRSAIASGVTSTPTFFIDGMRYNGSVSLQKMLAAIRELHPDITLADIVPRTPRIPRVRWPRAEQP